MTSQRFSFADLPVQSCSADNSFVPAIKLWRPYKPKDLFEIKNLVRPYTRQLFGPLLDVEEIIEYSNHRIVMTNTKDEIISCLCLRSYPNILAVMPDVWTQVLNGLYHMSSMTPENTLFIHFFVYDQRYGGKMLSHFLKSMYMCLFRLQFVVLVVLPRCKTAIQMAEHLLSLHFFKVLPHKIQKYTDYQSLYVSKRDQVLPYLTYRYATVEDNDDIVDMLDKVSPELKKTYGDFYIAHILLDKKTSRRILVSELNNEPIGMFGLNSEISLIKLFGHFEVGVYNNFCKKPKRGSFATSPRMSEEQMPFLADRIRSEIVSDMVDDDFANIVVDCLNKDSESSFDYSEFFKTYNKTMNLSSTTGSEDNTEDTRSIIPHSFSKRQLYNRGQVTTIFYMDAPVQADSGDKDAFLIELFAMHKSVDDRLVVGMLEAAFEVYPTYNYALISMPSDKYIPLLAYFVKVIPRPIFDRDSSKTLYALHRNALFSTLHVHHAIQSDEKLVRQFLTGMHDGAYHGDEIVNTIRQQSTEDGLHVFIVTMAGEVIGVCILRRCTDLEQLAHMYDLRQYCRNIRYLDNEACILQMMILHPAFMIRLPFIVSEFFRKSSYSYMLYKLCHASPLYQHQMANTMLVEMQTVLPRLTMHYELNNWPPYRPKPPAHIISPNNSDPFSLYYCSMSTCTKRKVHINLRIVIVGCCTTSISFINELLFNERARSRHLSNLTLISPNGFLEFEFESFSQLALKYQYKGRYTPDYMKRMGLRSWVNLVYGTMTGIDRKAKCVIVDEKRRVFYDRLYLFCGTQFDYPINIVAPLRQPRNVAFIKTCTEAEIFILKVQDIVRVLPEYNLVLYGDDRYCYTALQILLALELDPSRIVYIRPRSKDTVGKTTLFNDTFVDDVMDEMLRRTNIQIYDNYDVVNWSVERNNNVTKIFIESDMNVLEIPCSLFICYEREIVKRSTIRVLRKAGLMFNGRLFINGQFQTNDPNIYAAGPMTKYRASMYAEHNAHVFYSSYNIGYRLGCQTLDELDPFTKRPPADPNHIVGRADKTSKITTTVVLNDYHYFRICLAGKPVPIELERTLESYGVDLITGGNDLMNVEEMDMENLNYCRVTINKFNRIETIVSLSKVMPNFMKYKAIWNLNENACLNLRLRYEAGMIQDLHEFFTRPWVYMVYHDRFKSGLHDPCREILDHAHINKHELIDEISDRIVASNWQSLSEKERCHIVETYMTSKYERNIQKTLMEFIAEYCEGELAMHSVPNMEET